MVIAYSANEWDTSLTLKVECLDCHIEWGWSRDSAESNSRLQAMADDHNEQLHPKAGA